MGASCRILQAQKAFHSRYGETTAAAAEASAGEGSAAMALD